MFLGHGRGSRHSRTTFLKFTAIQLFCVEKSGNWRPPSWSKVGETHGAAGALKGRHRDCRKSREGWIQRKKVVNKELGQKEQKPRHLRIC